MADPVKKRWFWLGACALIGVAGYGALRFVQAVTVYQGERLLFNVRLSVATMLAGLLGAGVCFFFAVRWKKSSPRDSSPASSVSSPESVSANIGH